MLARLIRSIFIKNKTQSTEWGIIKEGIIKKGCVNKKPTTKRPTKPTGQGGLMKIINGFVSNSSSSSFVFKINDDDTIVVKDICPHCGQSYERHNGDVISCIDFPTLMDHPDEKETIHISKDKFLTNAYKEHPDFSNIYFSIVSKHNIERKNKIFELKDKGKIVLLECD